MMKILIYKRTHTGDPDKNGCFGIYDCMGRIRDYNYDAVIGVGGTGREPVSYGIDKKINWVGITPAKKASNTSPVHVKFDTFLLFEHEGPLLEAMAPHLAHRLYDGKARFLLTGYSKSEQKEAEAILEWALKIKKKKITPNIIQKKKSCHSRCKPLGKDK